MPSERPSQYGLFDLATLWEYLPLERRNPIEIVKIKNVTRRAKEAVMLSPEQFRKVIRRLPAHVNMIAITMACLGLRVSEALGLRWEDFDWQHTTVTIRRSAYRGAIDETKTTSSKAKLPLAPCWRSCWLPGERNRTHRGYSPIQLRRCRTCRRVCNSVGFDQQARRLASRALASTPCAIPIAPGLTPPALRQVSPRT